MRQTQGFLEKCWKARGPQPHTLAKLASVSLLQAVRSSSCRACSESREAPWGSSDGS